jgi:hypothetical protein
MQPVRWQTSRDTGRFPLLPIAAILLVTGGLVTLVVRRWGADRGGEATAAVRAEATVALDIASAAASPVMPDSAPSAEAVPRLARTWTKVRDGRSTRADVVAVLLPGDTVLADSLRGGWWRVALDGRVLGYAYGRTLDGFAPLPERSRARAEGE